MTTKKEVIELHERKVNGIIKRFPSGFWKEDKEMKCFILLDYVFREKFKFNDSRIRSFVNSKFITEQKLGSVIVQLKAKNYRDLLEFYFRERVQ
jgi:hypothetical protein